MIKIIELDLLILSMILQPWPVPPLPLPTPWKHGNSEARMAAENHAIGLLISSFGKDLYRNELIRIRIRQITQANFCWALIPKNQFQHSHIPSPITATVPFPKTCISTIHPNIVNSQHSPSCMIMTDVILK